MAARPAICPRRLRFLDSPAWAKQRRADRRPRPVHRTHASGTVASTSGSARCRCKTGFNVRSTSMTSMIANRSDSNYVLRRMSAKDIRRQPREASCSSSPAAFGPSGSPDAGHRSAARPGVAVHERPHGQRKIGIDTYWQVNHGSNVGAAVHRQRAREQQQSAQPIQRLSLRDRARLCRRSVSRRRDRAPPLPWRPIVRQPTAVSFMRRSSIAWPESRRRTLSNVPVAAFGKFFLTLPLMRRRPTFYLETWA